MRIMRTQSAPTDRRYTDLDSWLALAPYERLGDHPLRVGVTATAVDGVGIVSVELPRVGTVVEAGEPCALIWTRPLSLMPVYAPITGLVTVVNATLREDPSSVASDPFQAGWLFAVLPVAVSSTDGLLSASQYDTRLEGVAA
jgi:glycine cleavage system H protein